MCSNIVLNAKEISAIEKVLNLILNSLSYTSEKKYEAYIGSKKISLSTDEYNLLSAFCENTDP